MLKKIFSKKSLPKAEKKTEREQLDILPSDTFEMAMQHHQRGDFPQAEALYRKILQQEPDHPDALHYLGVLAYQIGQSQAAVELISKAIAVYPTSSAMYCNLGLALQIQGQSDAAVENYLKAISLQPDYSDAYTNLGHIYASQAKVSAAIEKYQQALVFNPNNAEVCNNLGCLLKSRHKLDEAIKNFQQAIFLKNDYVDAYYNLAITYKAQHKLDVAIENFQQTVLLKPDHADAYSHLGIVLHEHGNLDAALKSYHKALSLKPESALIYTNLGITQQAQGNLNAAFESYQHALLIDPNYAEAYCEQANLFSQQDKLEQAVESYQKALILKPDYIEVLNNLGAVFKTQGKVNEAISSFQYALSFQPDCADPYYNLAMTYKAQHKLDIAIINYQKAISFNPKHIEAHCDLGFLLLSLGQLHEGWQHFEARFDPNKKDRQAIAPPFPFPQWQGESVVGKSLVICAEQGLGDEIQFCRYASVLKAKGVRYISWVCKKPLKALFKTAKAIDNLFTLEEIALIPPHDYWLFALSIPLQHKTTLDNIPATVPYLYANYEQQQGVALRLKNITEFKIGVCWRGNPKFTEDVKRSPGISWFKSLFKLSGVKFFTLQPQTRSEFINVAGSAAVDFGHEIDEASFEEAAALIANLDLVISSCTSICHLAGALGKPVWIVLPFEADWRWFVDREDSPWYPTARLFRQTEAGNWEELFQRVETRLKQVLSGESQVVWPVS